MGDDFGMDFGNDQDGFENEQGSFLNRYKQADNEVIDYLEFDPDMNDPIDDK